MGFLGLNVMAAATGLLVPVPARQLDYLSTIHFMDTIAENIEVLEANGTPVDYGFIRIVCSAYSPSKPGENDMWKMMQRPMPTSCSVSPSWLQKKSKTQRRLFVRFTKASHRRLMQHINDAGQPRLSFRRSPATGSRAVAI